MNSINSRRKYDITDEGHRVAEVARDLRIYENLFNNWRIKHLDDTLRAFTSKGYLKPAHE